MTLSVLATGQSATSCFCMDPILSGIAVLAIDFEKSSDYDFCSQYL
jgi:hypothetical protein